MSQPKVRARGFSMLEFVVVGIVMAVLVGALLQRMTFYQEQAEQAAVERMVGVLRAALALRVGHVQASGKTDELALLAGQNPIDWLTERPPNYAGDFYAPVPSTLVPGQWYFNRSNKAVTYLLHYGKIIPQGTTNRVQYTVKSFHLPTDNAKSAATPTVSSVALIQLKD